MSLAARPLRLVPGNGPAAPVQDPCRRVSAATGEVPALETATDDQRARALGRLVACERSDALRAGGVLRVDADAQAAREVVERGLLKRASGRSVCEWRRDLRRAPAGGRVAALLDLPRSGAPRKEWRSPGADALWAQWVADYLRLEAPPATQVHDRLRDTADANDWHLPAADAFLVRTRREFTEAEITRARGGAIAALDLHPHQTRTVAGLEAMEIVNGDGHRFNVIVMFPDGTVGRPVGWFWQDVRTRHLLTYRIGRTESLDLVRTSLHELVVRHGVPGRVVVDNTRAASNKWLTGGMKGRKRWRSSKEELPGVLQLLEIDYRPTAVDGDAGGRGQGRGRSKPVERMFGDLADRIARHPDLAGAYTGRSTADRPENHRAEPADWATFTRVVEECVRQHGAKRGRRTEIASGRSFDETWADEYGRVVVRKLSAAQASLLLLAPEGVTVKADGTFSLRCGRGAHMPVNRYHDPSLVGCEGQHLVARFDPDDLHGPIHVHTMDGRYACLARCLLPVGFADQAAAREYERARREQRRSAERGLKAKARVAALSAARRSAPAAAPPDPEPAAVALVAGGLPELPPRGSAPTSSPRPAGNDKPTPEASTRRRGLRAGLRLLKEENLP